MTKLFVGNLPYSTTSEDLHTMFGSYGTILSAFIISDKVTRKGKGFGFVEFENDDEAQEAIKALNKTEVENRKIVVNVARPKQ